MEDKLQNKAAKPAETVALADDVLENVLGGVSIQAGLAYYESMLKDLMKWGNQTGGALL